MPDLKIVTSGFSKEFKPFGAKVCFTLVECNNSPAINIEIYLAEAQVLVTREFNGPEALNARNRLFDELDEEGAERLVAEVWAAMPPQVHQRLVSVSDEMPVNTVH